MFRKTIAASWAALLILAASPAAFAQPEEADAGGVGSEAPALAQEGMAAAQDPEPAPDVAGGGTAAPALTRADLETWLDGYMPYALTRGDIAGAVVTIVKDGEILLAKGYGYSDLEKRTPVDPARTLFRPGSVSKLFTWTAVMQLVEQGKLDLDTDINTYLDFQIPEAFGAPITLRHLMTHTPGFEEKVKNLIVEDPDDLLTLEAYLKSGVPERIFPPGTTPAYSNYGTALAGYIVQRVSGMPFNEYVERNIFEPLGMTRSTFRQPLPEDLDAEMATGYKKASEGEAQAFEIIAATPAGALSATGEDMARFMIAHLQEGGALLSPQTARQMHETADPHIPPLNSMRLGFYQANRNGQRVIAHGGDTQYFHSNLNLFLDQDIGLFVSMNSAGNNGATSRVRGFLFEAFTDRYFPREVEAAPVLDTAEAHAAEVAGYYEISRGIRTNFLALSGLLGQFRIVAEENGDLVTPAFEGVGGAPRRWREIEPYVWREVGGKDLLAARMEDGKVSMLSFEPLSPIIVFERPPAWRSQALLLPVVGASLGILALTILSWVVRAVGRWRFGAAFPLEGRPATAYRLVRLATLLLLIWFAAWMVLMFQMLSTLTLLDGSLDGLLRGLQFAAIIPVAALAVGVWNLSVVWGHKSGWLARLWSVLLLLSIAGLIAFCAVGSVFNFSLAY
ncbi:MAG: serine hydrolase domain-containing protein [Alphaproteobacteria bacterium]